MTPFPSSLWKKLSPEAKSFTDNLLNKDPKKRMTIKEVVEHPWIQKYNKSSKIFDQKRKSKDFSEFETFTNITETKK
jgi:serine/threonine protein kinase